MLEEKNTNKVLLIDGNSIMNRAFYGIMGSKMLTAKDGTYTNAVYGFLSILFKNIEEVEPEYMLIAFDSKTAADARKKMYEGYKKNRHGMPQELAAQMPIIKEVLHAMNIETMEKADYEGDDILGTYAKKFAANGKDVYILSGDRDLFQLIEENITVRIPRTKMGKTETEIYTKEKIQEEYGLEPEDLIEVKALMGDSSDEIPGVPSVGPKTSTSIIKEYKTIDNLYKALEEGRATFTSKLQDALIKNRDLAELSRELGRININVPDIENLEETKIKEWNREEVAKLFQKLNFSRFIERFNLKEEIEAKIENIKINVTEKDIEQALKEIEKGEELIFYIETENINDETRIIKKCIKGIGIYVNSENIYYIKINDNIQRLKHIFENEKIKKIGYNIKEDYVLLKEYGIELKGIKYDAEIAAYILNPTNTKHNIKDIAMQYLEVDLDELIPKKDEMQLNIFEEAKEISNKDEIGVYVYALKELYSVTTKKIQEEGSLELFENIEMPLVRVLGEMQYNGIIVEKDKLEEFGKDLKNRLNKLTKEIYELSGEEFNINSTQQLGKILFEKLKLTEPKKTKKGYATDVETLEGIIDEHPIVAKVLEYRSLIKLSSTYVDGLTSYINPKDRKIHAVFN